MTSNTSSLVVLPGLFMDQHFERSPSAVQGNPEPETSERVTDNPSDHTTRTHEYAEERNDQESHDDKDMQLELTCLRTRQAEFESREEGNRSYIADLESTIIDLYHDAEATKTATEKDIKALEHKINSLKGMVRRGENMETRSKARIAVLESSYRNSRGNEASSAALIARQAADAAARCAGLETALARERAAGIALRQQVQQLQKEKSESQDMDPLDKIIQIRDAVIPMLSCRCTCEGCGHVQHSSRGRVDKPGAQEDLE